MLYLLLLNFVPGTLSYLSIFQTLNGIYKNMFDSRGILMSSKVASTCFELEITIS